MDQEYTKEYYAKLAKIHGNDPRMSMRDPYIRECEQRFLLESIETLAKEERQYSVLDLGCGNGHTLKTLHDKSSLNLKLSGLELSAELTGLAQELQVGEVICADMMDASRYQKNSFDFIITERSIINILKLGGQKQALENIYSWLKPGGHYLCVESFREPLHNLSMATQEFGFTGLTPSKHNLYLWQEYFENYMRELGLIKEVPVLEENFLSTHFYLSRVVHRVIKPEGAKRNPKFFHGFFREALAPAIGKFSPILFYCWSKPLHQ